MKETLRPSNATLILCYLAATLGIRGQTSNFAGNAQHNSNYSQPAQHLNTIRWSTSVDLSNTGAAVHYGTPVISAANTVFVPVKAYGNRFQVSAFNGSTGAFLYTLNTDYLLPAYSWIPAYSPALTTTPSGTRLYYPGAGGTVYYVDHPDSAPSSAPVQLAFYGMVNYQANLSSFKSSVFIDTPITTDSKGDIFFGFRVQGTAPAPLNTTQSGFARIDSNGNGTYVLVGTAAGDGLIGRDSHNSAPALSNDEATVYVVAKGASTDAFAYLLGLDSTTLATKYKTLLLDPRNGNYATVTDDSTASPMVAPDNDVYIGVLGNPDTGYRGFLLRFSVDLSITKVPGAFGWDYTPGVVPAAMVQSYTGSSSYLIFSKYNNYAGAGDGDGVNRVALLDPNSTQVDPHPSANGLIEMREVLTVIGVTPDPDELSSAYPLAVNEWCVNTPAVNPSTKSIFTPSEDGHIYRWDLSTNSLSEAVQLATGIGQAYVPVVIGPDGTVYTMNGGNLFAVGSKIGVGVSIRSSSPDLRSVVAGDKLTFTAEVTDGRRMGRIPAGTVTFQATSFSGSTPINTNLAANVVLDATGHASMTTETLPAGGTFITATYSGDAQFNGASSTMIELVHASAAVIKLASVSHTSDSENSATLTATVAPAPWAAGVPTGMVTFTNGATVLAQLPVEAGVASISLAATLGNQGITAIYASDSVFATNSAKLVMKEPARNSLPIASNVAIAGRPYLGQTLIGKYDYTDVDGDPQGASVFHWLRDGSPISGVSTTSYTPTVADVSHAISFEVTPVAATGASPGTAVKSSAIIITDALPSGLLSGSANYATNPANLTIEGDLDWIHWGDSSLNRKATGGSQLSTYTVGGSSGILTYANDPRLLSWTDGSSSGTANGISDPNGVYLPNAVGNTFSFTAPADATVRTLVVHAGGYFSACMLTAHLSDSSAPDYVDTTSALITLYDRNYVLTYSAASPGQTLTVTWAEVTNLGAGNVNLSAAALSTFSGLVAPYSGNPQTTTVNTAFNTALQAKVTDSNSNPVSGATVTFTAPSGGASALFGSGSTATVVTGANGVATAPALTANSIAGGYYIIASVSGIPTAASFGLTNAPGTPVRLTPLNGTPGDAVVNTPYTTALQASVTDSNNNPVTGATVTFSAPTSGPSATFNGQTSVSAVTNSSGIIFAPTLTANSQVGSFVVTAAVAPGVSANFNLTNTGGGNGSLAGSANSSTASVNLTVVGTSDWIHWGDSSLNRKATGGSKISDVAYAFTQNLDAQPQPQGVQPKAKGVHADNMGTELYNDDSRLMGWTDGSPTTVSSNNGDGFYLDYGTYASSGRSGYTITAPADTTPRTLIVYVGGSGTGGTLTAHLSDASAPDFVDVTPLVSGGYDRNYTLTYSAGSPGQTLNVTWAMNSSYGNGNITLAGAALSFPGPTGGSLTGSGNSSSATDNLTSEGSADWVHWGDGILNRKSGVTAQISNYTVVGSGSVMSYTNDPRALSWTDGTPAASGTNNNGVYINSLQNGFSLTAPADTNTRVFTVHVGGWLSGGTLTAYLSDGSAAPFTDSTTAASGQYDRNYSLTYKAASTAQTLTVSWVATSGAGNVTLNGAALSLTAPSITASAGTPQSSVVGTAFSTPLQATVKDASGGALSGVTVTFTAPASGASGTFSGSTTATAMTNSAGVATAPSLSANTQVGTFAVTATGSGVSAPASFALTNLAGPAASITATSGTPQSTAISSAFGTALQAAVKDAYGNSVSGVSVTFMAPSTGAGATFGGAATTAVMTNSSGVATAPVLTANAQAGSYTVTAIATGVSTPASFSLTNLAGTPASVSVTAGNSQSATVATAYATPLQAIVKDANSNPLNGVSVTFTAPSTGAGASFAGSTTVTVMTNASGIATAPALTANSQAGSFTVTAAAPGVSTPASFSLTNLAGPAASISAAAGTPQSTSVSTAFTTALQAMVRDAYSNPLYGVTVTFTAPSTGASASFSGSAMATAMTNASGIATAPALTANSQAGTYSVTATAAGIGTPASFSLTNNAVSSSSGVSLVQQAAGSNIGNNQNTLTVTLGNSPNSGNVLVLMFDQVSAAQTITSISGATWTRVAQNFTGNIGDSEVWVGTNPTSSTITITGTNYFGIFQPGYAIVAEFTGIGSILDGTPLNTTSGIWPVTTGSLITTNPGDLLITSTLAYSGGGYDATVNNPWTLFAAQGGTYSLAAAYQIVNVTGSYSANWNGVGTPQVSTIILALKAGGGGTN